MQTQQDEDLHRMLRECIDEKRYEAFSIELKTIEVEAERERQRTFERNNRYEDGAFDNTKFIKNFLETIMNLRRGIDTDPYWHEADAGSGSVPSIIFRQ